MEANDITSVDILDIIMCDNKNALKKLCKNARIRRKDFVAFIMMCQGGYTHLNHTMHYFHEIPEQLQEKETDLAFLEASQEERRTPEGKKALNRLFDTHQQRKYKVAHMFFSREIRPPCKEWHMIFFEARERDDKGNHWCGGPHVHITNYLWTNLDAQTLWDNFHDKRGFPRSKLHVSFID